MVKTARITITSGPDRGKVFQLNEELVHIGSSAENHVALTDELVREHQASIVNRDGRYAIYTPLDQSVQVDGNVIPSEQWVWLPSSARITVSARTSFQFDELAAAAGDAPTTKPAAADKSKAAHSGKGKRASGKRRRSGKYSVARFITDQQGDTLVKLGEDGHLPELHLAEGENQKTVEKSEKKTNPTVLYAVLGISVCASLLLAVVDFEPSSRTVEDVSRARREIIEFYGLNDTDLEPSNDTDLEPYQQYLREARLAHSRGDRAAERLAYRKVLDLLSAEDVELFGGVTGDRETQDQRLKELVTTLYSGSR